MTTPDDAKAKAATTYNAAADYYDDPANSFWERFGRATVERLRLPLGARVLDVCCGTERRLCPRPRWLGHKGSFWASTSRQTYSNLREPRRQSAA